MPDLHLNLQCKKRKSVKKELTISMSRPPARRTTYHQIFSFTSQNILACICKTELCNENWVAAGSSTTDRGILLFLWLIYWRQQFWPKAMVVRKLSLIMWSNIRRTRNKHVFPNRPEYRLNNRDPKQCFRSSPSFSNPLPGRVSVSCSLIAIANQQLKILCLKVDIIFCGRMDYFGN